MNKRACPQKNPINGGGHSTGSGLPSLGATKHRGEETASLVLPVRLQLSRALKGSRAAELVGLQGAAHQPPPGTWATVGHRERPLLCRSCLGREEESQGLAGEGKAIPAAHPEPGVLSQPPHTPLRGGGDCKNRCREHSFENTAISVSRLIKTQRSISEIIICHPSS